MCGDELTCSLARGVMMAMRVRLRHTHQGRRIIICNRETPSLTHKHVTIETLATYIIYGDDFGDFSTDNFVDSPNCVRL